MALDRLQYSRERQEADGVVWRLIVITDGEKRVHIAFDPPNIRRPGHVRRNIFEAMRQHFPNYQRTIPRRRRTWR